MAQCPLLTFLNVLSAFGFREVSCIRNRDSRRSDPRGLRVRRSTILPRIVTLRGNGFPNRINMSGDMEMLYNSQLMSGEFVLVFLMKRC